MELDDEIRQRFNFDDFRIRLRNAVRTTGMGWIQFCETHRLPPEGMRLAIQGCERDLDRFIDQIELIAKALGRDLEWALTGVSRENDFPISINEHTRRLVDEYIVRDDVPHEDRSRLHEYVSKKLTNFHAWTPQAALRTGIPQNWRDVAYLYQEMLQLHG
jgi:hypothetical protein